MYTRYVKEPQPTVLDSVMIWNLNLMTATAQAAMPLAPLLRNTLLNQTRWVQSSVYVCSVCTCDIDNGDNVGADDVDCDKGDSCDCGSSSDFEVIQ